MLEARNITINYDSRIAVKDVSLRVRPAKVISIIGPNGAGKSTLLRALNGNVRPTVGEVILDEQPLQTYARRVVGQRVAVVAQEADVRFPVTVFEFVLGGRYASANVTAWGWESDCDIELAQNAIAETQLTLKRLFLVSENTNVPGPPPTSPVALAVLSLAFIG